ncbi:MAG: PA14 domain-containing protein [Opitutaceae bacterium]|nr:PA14 domain-containing protein [Opitutaceae bacterium]
MRISLPIYRILRSFVVPLCALLLASASVYSAPYTWRPVKMGGGGAVPGIVHHPKVRDLVYIRTDVGDLYRWNAGTSRWESTLGTFPFDDANLEPRYGVESFAINPTDTSGNFICAVIGKDAWNSYVDGQYIPRRGYFIRSNDRGRSWTVCRQFTPPTAANWTQPYGERLAVDPNNPSVIYWGTRDGLYRSFDSGDNWGYISGTPKGTVQPYVQDMSSICWVVIDPSKGTVNGRSKRVYMGVLDAGIYMSDNGGDSFTQLRTEHSFRAEVAGNGELWVGAAGAVLRMANDGTWTSFTPAGNGANYVGIGLDPNNPSHIIVSGHFYGFYNSLYRTTTGGSGWTRIGEEHMNITKPSWWPAGFTSASIFEVSVDPFNSKAVWYVNWYGTLVASDIDTQTNGKYNFTAYLDGHEETVSTGTVVSPPSGDIQLYTGMADVGGAFQIVNPEQLPINPRDRGMDANFDGTDAAYMKDNPQFAVLVGRQGWFGRGIGAYSENGGGNWTEFSSYPASDGGGGVVAIRSSLYNGNPLIVWLAAGKYPHYSTNRGVSWTPVSGLDSVSYLDSGSIFETLARPLTATDAGGFYLYSKDQRRLYRSSDGITWVKTAYTGLPGYSGGDLNIVNPNVRVHSPAGRSTHVWINFNDGGLWYSQDSGDTFTRLSNVSQCYTFGFGATKPGASYPTLYIVGRASVSGNTSATNRFYRSIDAGATWEDISDPNQLLGNLNSIGGDGRKWDRVWVGTDGVGYWYGDGDGSSTNPPPPSGGNLLTNPGFENGTTGWSGSNSGTDTAYARSGSAAGVAWWTGSLAQTVTGLQSGTTYRLTGYARVYESGVTGSVTVSGHGGAQGTATVTSQSFGQFTIDFTTGASSTSATVTLVAPSNGMIIGDDFDLRAVGSSGGTSITIPNAGFESGTTNWSGWNNGTDGGFARSGAAGGVTWWGGVLEQTVSGLQPNTDYTLTAWARVAESGVTGSLVAASFGGTDKSVSTSNQSWEQLTVTFRTGASNTSVLIRIVAPSNGMVAMDDLTLTSASGSGSLSAPQITSVEQNSPVTVRWTDVSGETGYRIERKTASGSWTQVGTTAANVVSFQDSGASVTGEVYQYRIFATNGSTSSAASQAAWSVKAAGVGSVAQATWTGLSGTLVSAINRANVPSYGRSLTSLETAQNQGDNFGTLIRGYLKPTVTGTYRFWIAGDDNSEFWLSTDANPANKVRRAYVEGWTNYREWNKYTTQKSVTVSLSAGTRYYFEVLHKEGAGGDSVSVGWVRSSTATTPSEVVPTGVLLPY